MKGPIRLYCSTTMYFQFLIITIVLAPRIYCRQGDTDTRTNTQTHCRIGFAHSYARAHTRARAHTHTHTQSHTNDSHLPPSPLPHSLVPSPPFLGFPRLAGGLAGWRVSRLLTCKRRSSPLLVSIQFSHSLLLLPRARPRPRPPPDSDRPLLTRIGPS